MKLFEYQAFDLPNRLLFFARNKQNLELFNLNMVNYRLEIFEFFQIYCIEVRESSYNGNFYPTLSDYTLIK